MSKAKENSNWGKGVFVLYAGFVIFILALVLFVSLQDISLVDDNYYDKDLTYQKQIERLRRTQELQKDISIDFAPTSGILSIIYPEETITDKTEGTVKLYRPSNSRYDRVFEVDPDKFGHQIIETDGLIPGLWRIKITWGKGDLEYYGQKILIIN